MSEFKPWRKPQIAGRKNPRWTGGKIVTRDGRVMIYSPHHPHASQGRYVYRYRLKIEKKIGRFLETNEVIHHKNGIVSDDRLSNLKIMDNREHSLLHGAAMRAAWARHYSHCSQCGTTESEHKGHGLCTRCVDKKRWPERQLRKLQRA